MTIRQEAKEAVKIAKSEARSMWIDLNLITHSPAAYDPLNPEASNSVSITVLGLEGSFNRYLVDNANVMVGDRLFYIDMDDITDVSIIDQISIGGVEYEVYKSNPIQQDVLLEVHLRAGD